MIREGMLSQEKKVGREKESYEEENNINRSYFYLA